ncbi:DUF1684 domain-containing protein [Nibrella saemangeumensis]|uniref:DUF1684 domain-containing protein n=1 Tax=Nibrella saemangeumensis TaxID=1084526 RepID=A0ABP8N690_9BACT
MFRNRFLQFGLLITVLGVLYFIFFDNDSASSAGASENIPPETYRRQVGDERQKKDDFFRTSSDSPVSDKTAFRGLLYFPPDLTYRVSARVEPFADKSQKLIVRMSDGSEEVYTKYAHAAFSLEGQVHRLLMLQHDGNLSILFRDATSGKETYGGGRYIDIEADAIENNRVVLDFNAAYNPYCAYNPEYACPLPPAENTLPVAIRAGEKYVDSH